MSKLTEQEQEILDNAPEGAEYYYRDANTGRYHYSEFAGQARLDTLRKKQGKPVYTKEMHDNDIDPKVGSEVILCIHKHARVQDSQRSHNGEVMMVTGFEKGCPVLKSTVKGSEFNIILNNAHFKPLEPVKPVYTQAMKDAGELPSVGMRCHIEYVNQNSLNSTITYITKEVGCYLASNGKEFTFATESVWFRPIDTRTPEQKQVDSAVQDIMSAMFDVDENEAKSIIEMLQERERLAKIN